MSKKTPKPDDEDGAHLWEIVAKTVTPLSGNKRKPVGKNTKKRKAEVEIKNTEKPFRPLTPEQLAAMRAAPQNSKPAQRKSLGTNPKEARDASAHKGVRRGRVEPQAQLDLHGMGREQAFSRLLSFLSGQRTQGARCVLVITGRGTRDLGVLRQDFSRWMGLDQFGTIVASYAPAHSRHGGKGAWYVFLRKPSRLENKFR